MDLNVIKARRERIESDSPCDGCGASLELCLASRGRDKTAPSWFGCCARGTGMLACRHVPDHRELQRLLREIEDGEVAPVPTPEDELLVSITESSSDLAHMRRLSRRIGPRDGLFDGIYPQIHYAREEHA